MPAPPPESEPAIESRRGGSGAGHGSRSALRTASPCVRRPARPASASRPGRGGPGSRPTPAGRGPPGPPPRSCAPPPRSPPTPTVPLGRAEHAPQQRIRRLGWRRRRRRRHLARSDAEQLVEHVLGSRDRHRAVAQQPVRAARHPRGHVPRHGGDRPAEVAREVARDQAAARIGGLDHDRHARQPGHDPVAGREAPPERARARRQLGEHDAVPAHLAGAGRGAAAGRRTSGPQASTATGRPPPARQPRCAAASIPSAKPADDRHPGRPEAAAERVATSRP